MKQRVALVGTASSGAAAPYGDPSWRIWGVSARAPYVTRADRWFEMHRIEAEPPEWAKQWREKLKEFTTDIGELVMLYPEPDLAPKVIRYPYDRITARFGTRFMSSTFAWMMALAIDEMVPQGVAEPGACEIGLFGVDMEYGTEYLEQRSGFHHFIEVAKVLGIEVTRLASSGLAYEPVPYPLIQDDPLLSKLALRSAATKEQLSMADNSLRLTQTMMAQHKAVLGEIDMMLGEGYDPKERAKMFQKELKGLEETSARLSRDIVHLDGIDSEQKWLKSYLTA